MSVRVTRSSRPRPPWADTDDHAYGQSACKSLATSNPTRALDNADSHEYFAENTPSLP